jgi:hypothetical protein
MSAAQDKKRELNLQLITATIDDSEINDDIKDLGDYLKRAWGTNSQNQLF